eukprot:gene10688-2786_t
MGFEPKLMTMLARRFVGKTAVVTAATDGIGRAIAQRLGEEGANVVVSSRRIENVTKTVQQFKEEGISVHGVVCNVSRHDDRQQLIHTAKDHFGCVDILVSNAAISLHYGPALETTEAVWNKTFDVNVKSTYMLAKEAAPFLKEQNGNMLFVSSIAGFTPLEGLGVYSISKTALFGLTKVLAEELGPSGVRVNCLAPGIIRTKFSKVLYEGGAYDEILRRVPLKRLGEPQDMAAVAAFLCSNDAAYITGETVTAAGGMMSRL